jgi:hypothetical protein
MPHGVVLGRERAIYGLHGRRVSTGDRALRTDFGLCEMINRFSLHSYLWGRKVERCSPWDEFVLSEEEGIELSLGCSGRGNTSSASDDGIGGSHDS